MSTPTDNHTVGAGVAEISDILIEDRYRTHEHGGMTPEQMDKYVEEDLVPSIAEYGLINPVVLEDTPNGSHKYKLIDGECRIRAFIACGKRKIPFCYRSDLDSIELRILEYEANAKRKPVPWQAECVRILEVHHARQKDAAKKYESWGYKETGDLIGTGKVSVLNACAVAEQIIAGNEAVLSAKNMQTAMNVMLKAKNEEAAKHLAAITGALVGTKQEVPSKDVLEMGPVKHDESGKGIDIGMMEVQRPEQGDMGPVESLPISEWLKLGDCISLMNQMPEASVDCVFTDIPYGIDMDNLDYTFKDVDRVASQHDVVENVELMPKFLNAAYRVLRDKTYLAYYCDLAHWEKLLGWAREAGFSTQNWPVIWCKAHPCQNRSAGTWYTKCTEYLMICRKGTATLQEKRPINYMIAEGLTEKKLYRHPFTKPFEVNKWILESITVPGDIVLDPFCGEGSLLVSALNLKRQIRGFEIEEDHFVRCVEQVKGACLKIARGNCQFT